MPLQANRVIIQGEINYSDYIHTAMVEAAIQFIVLREYGMLQKSNLLPICGYYPASPEDIIMDNNICLPGNKIIVTTNRLYFQLFFSLVKVHLGCTACALILQDLVSFQSLWYVETYLIFQTSWKSEKNLSQQIDKTRLSVVVVLYWMQ